MGAAYDYGERKHETCRFGGLSKAYRVDYTTGAVTPNLMPLCGWVASEPVPPATVRVWGGAVEFERDCAVCLAHKPVPDDIDVERS